MANPFRANAVVPTPTGSSSVPSFHTIIADGETTIASSERRRNTPPPLPPRRSSSPPIEREEPPPYSATPASYQGETTLQYGPQRPFQPPPQVQPQTTGFAQHTQHLPPQPTGVSYQSQAPTNSTPPRWLNEITRNPTVHQAWGIARQMTGEIRRELQNLETRTNTNNSYRPPLAPHPTGQHSSPYIHPPPNAPSPPFIPPVPPIPPSQPHSDFAREFYAAGAGSGNGDPRGAGAYAPPPGPPQRRRTRSAEAVPSAPLVPDDGRPTTTPMPGHPLINKGSILVYPKGHFCQKCRLCSYHCYQDTNQLPRSEHRLQTIRPFPSMFEVLVQTCKTL